VMLPFQIVAFNRNWV